MPSGWQWRRSQAVSALRSSVATLKIARVSHNLQSKVSQPGRGTARKGQFEREIVTLIAYYARLIRYATFSKSEADFSADTESKP